MIRPININLNAAHPELPLVEATTFTSAPSSVFIRGVPKAVGNWSITAVYVAVTYPDNSTTTRAAVESAEGVWVATIPGTATSGRTVAGFRILADGIDENGEAVTGYVLGFADFSVLSFTPVPAPGGTFWLLRYFDAMPTTPKKGDVAVVGGVLKYYNGTTWLPFADLTNKADSSSIAAMFDASKQGGYAVGDIVMYNGVRYRCTVAHTGAWDAAHFVAQTVEAAKADDNAVVKLTGDPQTMSAVLQLLNTLYAESGVESHGDYRLTWTVGGNYAGELTISQDTISVQLADEIEPRQYKLQAGGGGTVALLENIAPEFVYGHPYGVDELCTSYDADSSHRGRWLYKCIVATDGSTYPEIDPTHWALATVEDVLAALRTAIAGKADVSAIPYTLGTPIVVNTASSEVVEGETIYYGSETLEDRTANIVQVTAATALDELRITFPAATSGKVRDFGLRVEIGTGSAALAAPALVPVAPTGETIKIENADGTIPELADGTATAKGVTLLYFSETAPGIFVVKGEQVEEVA